MPLALSEQADEMLLMGLRISEGVDLARLLALTGLSPAPARIAELEALGMIAYDASVGRLRASDAGRFLTNTIVLELSRALETCA